MITYIERFFARHPGGDLYRVYVQGGNLTFVRVAGRDVVRGFISCLPVVHGPLGERWDERSRRSLMRTLAADDRRDVRALLARDPRNFRVAARQIQSAVIDAQDHTVDRPHHGILRILGAGRSTVFLLEELPEMVTAVRLLRESLGDLLVNHTVWSPHKKRFVSERSLSMSSRTYAVAH